jgi:cytochrome c oxidase subunit IV
MAEAADREGAVRSARRYLRVYAALFTLTAAELLVTRLPVERASRITALVGLAMIKAALILSAFMGLGRAGRALRAVALLPFLTAAGVAAVLMLETAWHLRLR